MSGAARSIRLFRLTDETLVLECEGERFDLSRRLRAGGEPTDLVELCARGWFDAGVLGPRLPNGRSGDWPRYEGDAGGSSDADLANAPRAAAAPLAPRQVGKVLALGKNFKAHAEEFGETVPEEMLFFNKLPETIAPHRGTTVVSRGYTRRVDHEAELAVVVGRAARDVAPEAAMAHVAGYSVANDLTLRSLQGEDREKGLPWFRSKNADGFLPLGPCFVPRDFLDLSDLRVTARVNGELRQDATTRDFVIDVPHALSHLSRHMTLRPGDLILMGTPAGVGPLAHGDVVTCAVDGIGELVTHIARP